MNTSSFVTKQLNGETGDDVSEDEVGEPSTSVVPSTSAETPKSTENSTTDDHSSENILSIIDIKAECDTKEDTKEVPVIDLAIAL